MRWRCINRQQSPTGPNVDTKSAESAKRWCVCTTGCSSPVFHSFVPHGGGQFGGVPSRRSGCRASRRATCTSRRQAATMPLVRTPRGRRFSGGSCSKTCRFGGAHPSQPGSGTLRRTARRAFPPLVAREPGCRRGGVRHADRPVAAEFATDKLPAHFFWYQRLIVAS